MTVRVPSLGAGQGVGMKTHPLPGGLEGSAQVLTDPVSGNAITPVTAVRSRVPVIAALKHQRIAAGAGFTKLGVGALGDVINHVLICPLTVNPGLVKLRDGSNGAEYILFAGGTLATVIGWDRQCLMQAANTAAGVVANQGWYLTTGANVEVVAVGDF